MRVSVNQMLHGYGNGHQLLAASFKTDDVDSKLLLFQSDLSGPTLVNGFDTYTSGFPLHSSPMYAFSRTWYANEMSRPGCVWTHTILIEFSDIGKLNNLGFLNEVFKRPTLSQYSDYSKTIDIDVPDAESTLDKKSIKLKNQISTLLYDEFGKTIVIPSARSNEYEAIVFEIWSNQWPRLRRNFSFCTGSLSLRSIDNIPYDLQVVPFKLVDQIKRQSSAIAILSEWSPINEVLENVEINEGRIAAHLLRLIGSDVEGDRKNFLPLIKLVRVLSSSSSISDISKLLMRIFPNENEATVFKAKLYGGNNSLLFEISEYETLVFLLTEPDQNLTFLNLGDLDLESRLERLLKSNEITIEAFAELYYSAKTGRISEDIWRSVDIDLTAALGLFVKYPQLSLVLIDNNPSIAATEQVWHLPFKFQQKVVKLLGSKMNQKDWVNVMFAIYRSKSEILYQLIPTLGVKYLPMVLETFAGSERDPIDIQRIINENYSEFRKWLQAKGQNIHAKIFEAVFIGLDFQKIQKLDLAADVWIYGYNALNGYSKKVNDIFVSCVLLSMGFQNRIDFAEKLVARTFEIVYMYGRHSQLNSGIWQLINRDDYYEDNDRASINFWSIFTRKKKDRVPYWDYCESLVRIGGKAFLKNRWSTQVFCSAFLHPEIFERVIDYLLTFEKGESYMEILHRDVTNGKISLTKKQAEVFKNFFGD